MPRTRKLVVGNWKMNGTRASSAELLDGVVTGLGGQCGSARGAAELAICVPFTYLVFAERMLRGTAIAVGAQNLSEHRGGAFTGEVSASMLVEAGCQFVIVGHSERRSLQKEVDDLVAMKARIAIEHGLTPIVCVGETRIERDAGRTESVVRRQLDAVLGAVERSAIGSLVVAYEPVWAIGSGLLATPEQAQAVHAFIRLRIAELDPAAALAARIIYGGSVKAASVKRLFAEPDIDGVLVGGASLVASEFVAMATA